MSPRTLFDPYRRLFAVPGARAFSLAGLFARVPMATVGLGTVLLVAGEADSYGLAGAVSGTLAIAFAAASPQWARAMDRHGQGAVLRGTSALYLAAGVAFVVAVLSGAPHWTWFALAALTGASGANVGSVVRSRWAAALPEPAQRQTAFAFESVVDEVVFVVTPPLITLLATLVAPPLGFLAGLVCGVVGAQVLSRQVGTQPPVTPVAAGRRRHRSPVLSPALLVVAFAYLAGGTVFGAMDVVVVAFAEAEGSPATAGLVLACYAGGSLVAGLVYGVLPLPGTMAARFVVAAVGFGVLAQPLMAVGSLGWLVPAAFLAGLAMSPFLVGGMSLVESRVDRSAVNEGLAWTSTGLTLGTTVGAAVAGAAVDAWGAETALAVPALAAAAAGVAALLGSGLLRERPAPAPLVAAAAPTSPRGAG